jgi:hypothetical protein
LGRTHGHNGLSGSTPVLALLSSVSLVCYVLAEPGDRGVSVAVPVQPLGDRGVELGVRTDPLVGQQRYFIADGHGGVRQPVMRGDDLRLPRHVPLVDGPAQRHALDRDPHVDQVCEVAEREAGHREAELRLGADETDMRIAKVLASNAQAAARAE